MPTKASEINLKQLLSVDVAPLIMEFQPAGQQECLSNFIVVQQEQKSNKFSGFSFCNMSVWQCKGKKKPKFLEKVLKEIKLMNCEQVMVAQKGM